MKSEIEYVSSKLKDCVMCLHDVVKNARFESKHGDFKGIDIVTEDQNGEEDLIDTKYQAPGSDGKVWFEISKLQGSDVKTTRVMVIINEMGAWTKILSISRREALEVLERAKSCGDESGWSEKLSEEVKTDPNGEEYRDLLAYVSLEWLEKTCPECFSRVPDETAVAFKKIGRWLGSVNPDGVHQLKLKADEISVDPTWAAELLRHLGIS